MVNYFMVIKGSLVDLNKYIEAERTNRFMGAEIKSQETEFIYHEAKKQKLEPIKKYPITVQIDFYCENRRKDPDNIAFTKKYILDGLVRAKILKNDGFKQIKGFIDNFYLDKENPRIEVFLCNG